MAALSVLVDFDNVEPIHKSSGAVNLAKVVVSHLPKTLVARHTSVSVRLYGGWRVEAIRTAFAQTLVPDIQANSPCPIPVTRLGQTSSLLMKVELADGPIGSRQVLEGTFVRGRSLRNFSSRNPWSACTSSGCGMKHFQSINHSTPCTTPSCGIRLGDVLVRDEQKMVDTLIVADMAHQTFQGRATDIVLVSSDADLWPGVLLSLSAGCSVTQVHTKLGMQTQSRLLNNLAGPMRNNYIQLSL